MKRHHAIAAGLALVIADDARVACELAEGGKLLVHLLVSSPEKVEPLRGEVAAAGQQLFVCCEAGELVIKGTAKS